MIITYLLPMYNLVTRLKKNYGSPHTVCKWETFQTLDPPHRWVHYLVDGEVLGRGGDGVLFYQVVHILHHHCLFLQWVNLSTKNESDRNLSSFLLFNKELTLLQNVDVFFSFNKVYHRLKILLPFYIWLVNDLLWLECHPGRWASWQTR